MNPNSLAIRILTDPSASYWLKDAIKGLVDRDPVDALADAEALRDAMRDNLTLITGRR